MKRIGVFVALESFVVAMVLTTFSWIMLHNMRSDRTTPAGVVVLALCLATAFGLALGAGIRAQGTLRVVLLLLTAAVCALIAIITRAGLQILAR